MSWLKFDTTTPEKPEVLAITVAMGWDDPDLTVGKLLKVWRWFDQHTHSGNAPGVTAALLDRTVGVTGIAQAMANVGWLLIEEGGLRLPNFDKHNGATAKTRATTAKRVANHRATEPCNGASVTSTVTKALARERVREEKKNPPTPRRGKGFDPTLIELPDWLDPALWAKWCKDRKDRKKPITEEGARAQIRRLDDFRQAGQTPQQVLDHAMAAGHQGLYPPAPSKAPAPRETDFEAMR